jgi:tRNA-modifying protein YgfZ
MNLETYTQAKQGLLCADLSHLAKWQLSGPDRIRFLNGQTTCHVSNLALGSSTPGAVTNLKGKLEAFIHLASDKDALLLDADASLRESLFARLNKYLIADDAELIDLEDTWKLYHVLTPHSSPQDISHFPFLLPPSTLFFQSQRFGLPGIDLWLPASETISLPCAEPDLWETLRIENAVPRWGVDMDQNNLAPEMPLEQLGALSYNKGCYIGQEVIARIRSRGHVNKQLCQLHSNSTLPDPLNLPLDCLHQQQSIGKVTSLCPSPARGGTVALATLSHAFLKNPQPLLVADHLFQMTSI